MRFTVLREEFGARNFLYEYPDKTAFYRCMWKWPRPVWIAIRMTLALYMVYGFTHELYSYYTTARNYGANDGGNATVFANSTMAQQELRLGAAAAAAAAVNKTGALAESLKPTTVEWSFGHLIKVETTTEKPAPQHGWDTRRPWWAFFTLWTYTVLLVHLVLAAVLSVVFAGSPGCHETYELGDSSGRNNAAFDGNLQEKPDHMPPVVVELGEMPRPSQRLSWYFKLSWLLSDIITPLAPIVTLVFFGALYSGGPVDIFNTNIHVLNAVFVAVDQLLSARPVKLLHFLAPMAFGFVYDVFNFIFWTSDHVEHVLYPGVIDWNYPLQTVGSILGMGLVMTTLIHLFWFGLYRAKLWLHSRIYNA